MPPFDKSSAPQLAAAARRGDVRALGLFLKSLSDRLGSLSVNELSYLDGIVVGSTVVKAPLAARTTHFEVFDDFLSATINTGLGVDNWITFGGTDGDADAAATVAGTPEGAVSMGSGDAGATEDGAVMSLILLAKGSLVSLGMTVFECRVSFDQITGVTACFGLSDKLATDAEHLLHTIIAGTVADGGLTVADTVEFVYSEEATAGTLWHAASENNGTIGNSGAEQTLVVGPTIDEYQILRIEVDATGDARFYINGILRHTRLLAVKTAALLIPYIAIDGEAATPVVTDLTIDYVFFAGARATDQ